MTSYKPGDAVIWCRTNRGGYGFKSRHKARVVNVTWARVRIRLEADGRETTVSPENLMRATEVKP